MLLRILFLCFIFIGIKKTHSQNMNKLVKDYELILTNNYELPYSFFEEEISKTGSVYLEIMLIYKSIIDKKVDKAQGILKNIVGKIPKEPMFRSLIKMNEGLILKEKGEDKKSIERLKEALELDIHKENKWIRLELYLALKKSIPYEAWGYLEEAIKIDPNFYWALVEKSFEFDEYANCHEIIDMLSKLPDSYKDSDALNLVGVAESNCGNYEKAKIYFEKSILIKETSDNTFSLGQLYHEYYRNYEKAENLYKKSLDINPANLDCRNAYAWLLFDTQRNKEGEEVIKSLLNYSEEQEVFNQIITFYLMNKEVQKAKELLMKSIEKNGINYMSDGYEILIKIINKEDYKNFYTDYRNKYGSEKDEWLRNLIAEILN